MQAGGMQPQAAAAASAPPPAYNNAFNSFLAQVLGALSVRQSRRPQARDNGVTAVL